MYLFEINGTYGSQQTPCTVYCAEQNNHTWYVCEGSVNVNQACNSFVLQDGTDVEYIQDIDMFTASSPIESLEDLEREVLA